MNLQQWIPLWILAFLLGLLLPNEWPSGAAFLIWLACIVIAEITQDALRKHKEASNVRT